MTVRKSKIFRLGEDGAAEKLQELGMTYEQLLEIKNDFISKTSQLNQAATYVTNVLLQTPGVHSVRSRTKDSDHLVDKIFRKRQENTNRIITLNNYEKQITDLIGVRIIRLFKGDWDTIHAFITNTWKLKEKPTAYHREGDSIEYLKCSRKRVVM